MDRDAAHLDLAARFFDAIPRGDVDYIRANVYAPQAKIYHNNGNETQDVDTNLRVLRWVSRNVKDLRYEDVEREATATGFVQRHVLRGIAPNGATVAVPACVVCTVEDGRVTYLAEYLDSADIQDLFAR